MYTLELCWQVRRSHHPWGVIKRRNRTNSSTDCPKVQLHFNPIKASQHIKLRSEKQRSPLSHDPSDRNAAAIVCKLGSK